MKLLNVIACRFRIVFLGFVLINEFATAGPLFPPVVASRSMNGNFLVLIEENHDASTANRRAPSRTYVILQPEHFSNHQQRLQTGVPFWSFRWQVTPDGSASQSLYLPMISNDGETLVLIKANQPAMTSNPKSLEVARIYHWQGNAAKLIRSLQLSDLWTADELKKHVVIAATDATPEWYAGSTLVFSADGEDLIYRSQWNSTVKIKLADGSATFERH